MLMLVLMSIILLTMRLVSLDLSLSSGDPQPMGLGDHRYLIISDTRIRGYSSPGAYCFDDLIDYLAGGRRFQQGHLPRFDQVRPGEVVSLPVDRHLMLVCPESARVVAVDDVVRWRQAPRATLMTDHSVIIRIAPYLGRYGADSDLMHRMRRTIA